MEDDVKEIEFCKGIIIRLYKEFDATRNMDLIDEVKRLKYRMFKARCDWECYRREKEELNDFLRELINPLSCIINSSFVTDICGNITTITLFYIMSVLFYSSEHNDIMSDYTDHIYPFIVR